MSAQEKLAALVPAATPDPARPRTAAQRVADYLLSRGLTQVFAVTGGGSMFLNHAFATHDGMNCTFMHHEQACAMAAEGYARITGRPAVLNVTTGPGSINALNGVFGAYTDSIPMIVLSGQVKRETCLGTTPVPGLRQLGDQEGPIVDMARPVTKGAWLVKSLDELARLLPEAVSLATTGRPGPVWLDIPIDLQSSREAFEFKTVNVKDVPDPAALMTGARQVAELLRGAHRPLILAGTGVRISGAQDALLHLVEEFGIPMATAWTHDLIASDHRLFAGRPGTIGTRAGNFCLQNADLVIVLGSRLNVRQVSYNWQSFARNATVVQVDIDPAELHKPLVRPKVLIAADAKAFVGALEHTLRTQAPGLPSYAPWVSWCQKIGRDYPALEPGNRSEKGINPYTAVASVFESLPDDAIVACGNASACIIPFQIARLSLRQRLFSNSGSASMGYELPAAIGAAVAAPRRRVVCMAGDGSLQMNVQELQTLATHQLNVLIVVLANDGYLSIRLSHENFFGEVFGADESSGVKCPDYVQLARAYGISALDINSPDDLVSLATCIRGQGPKLVQIHVDRNQGFSPKLKSRMDDSGKMLTPELDDLFPFLAPQDLDAIRSSAAKITAIKKQD